MKYSSRYYEESNGSMPVQDYVDSLNSMEKAKLHKIRNDYLAVYGPRTPDNIMHRVQEFDQLTFGNHRVLCKLNKNEYVMLHAFRKKGQKTKDADIQIATRRWQQEQARIQKQDLS